MLAGQILLTVQSEPIAILKQQPRERLHGMNPTNCFLTAFKIYQELQVHQHVTSLDYLIHEFGHGFPLISLYTYIYIYIYIYI